MSKCHSHISFFLRTCQEFLKSQLHMDHNCFLSTLFLWYIFWSWAKLKKIFFTNPNLNQTTRLSIHGTWLGEYLAFLSQSSAPVVGARPSTWWEMWRPSVHTFPSWREIRFPTITTQNGLWRVWKMSTEHQNDVSWKVKTLSHIFRKKIIFVFY